MRFEPPRQGQGQSVTDSYARTSDGLRVVRRVYDAANRTVAFGIADLSDDDDPWLSEPRVVGAWRPAAADELAALGLF